MIQYVDLLEPDLIARYQMPHYKFRIANQNGKVSPHNRLNNDKNIHYTHILTHYEYK